ncbi:MAG: hypothetical protein LBM98_01915 [Oscillospiraceae bacterium]|nr:hypothetical protein [Oscillospiraceae bacterium]
MRRVGAGFKPALPRPTPCAWCAVPAPRHCEPREAIQAQYPRLTQRPGAPSLRAPPHLRYVGRIGARQSSAGSVTYVCFPPGTGLLRTCNWVRIAHLPVLRNDGLLNGYLFNTRTKPTSRVPPVQTSVSDI